MYAKTINKIFVTYHLKGGVNPKPPLAYVIEKKNRNYVLSTHTLCTNFKSLSS